MFQLFIIIKNENLNSTHTSTQCYASGTVLIVLLSLCLIFGYIYYKEKKNGKIYCSQKGEKNANYNN